MNVLALICARGGSKGVPGKNVRSLRGRPLISWSIDVCKTVTRISRIIVSTDSADIAKVACNAGADVPFTRPAELATDSASEWLVWRHALEWVRNADGQYPDVLLVVPPTAPLRSTEDLERCLDEFERGAWDVVITVTEAHRNPYFNMVTVADDGSSRLVIPSEGAIARRQDVPAVFDMTTVAYVARPDFVVARNGLFDGRVGHVMVPPARALDIDTMLDFSIAECLVAPR